MVDERKKIVYIEDEPDMIALAESILGRKKFEVTGAVGGRKGLETVRRIKPDLVLLDLMMPDIDGWEVYKQMKADEELKDIPVIIVTAKSQPIDEFLAVNVAEVDGYVTKPFGLKKFVQSVEQVLGD